MPGKGDLTVTELDMLFGSIFGVLTGLLVGMLLLNGMRNNPPSGDE